MPLAFMGLGAVIGFFATGMDEGATAGLIVGLSLLVATFTCAVAAVFCVSRIARDEMDRILGGDK